MLSLGIALCLRRLLPRGDVAAAGGAAQAGQAERGCRRAPCSGPLLCLSVQRQGRHRGAAHVLALVRALEGRVGQGRAGGKRTLAEQQAAGAACTPACPVPLLRCATAHPLPPFPCLTPYALYTTRGSLVCCLNAAASTRRRRPPLAFLPLPPPRRVPPSPACHSSVSSVGNP